MKAMILAAGLGTRLRPLTETIPKPLLPVAGVPLIVWNLLLLRQHGITDVIVNLHHLGHLIEQTLGDGSKWGMSVSYSREAVILGTGGGIKQAEAFFGGGSFLVLNGDTMMDLDLGEVVRAHRERGALATMVLREDPDARRWGSVEVDQAGRVCSINGWGRADAGAGGPRFTHMFAGVHVMEPRLLDVVPSGQESSIIDAYVRSLALGELIGSFLMRGYWSDVGTPDRYAQVQKDAEAGLITLAARERRPTLSG
jgi:NDP-sugar pyrophosphorylase family protein